MAEPTSRSPRGEHGTFDGARPRPRARGVIRAEIDRIRSEFLEFMEETGSVVASQRELAEMFDARPPDLRRALAGVCVDGWWLADRKQADDDCCGAERYPVLVEFSSEERFAPYRYTLRAGR